LTMAFTFTKPATDAVTLCKDSPHYHIDKELDTFKIKGIEYRRCSTLQTSVKKKRMGGSLAWRCGEQLLRVRDNRTVYYCWLCERQHKPQQLQIVNGNTPVLDYLRDEHKLDKEGNSIATPVPTGQLQMSVNTMVHIYSYKRFQELVVRWMVYCFIAFCMVENQYFRELVSFMNAGLGALLPKASSTIRGWIKEAFDERKVKVKEDLHFSRTEIHLSFRLRL